MYCIYGRGVSGPSLLIESTDSMISENMILWYTYPLILEPPPPIRVQGLCSVVVWYSPAVSCEDIHGYEVRLYNPQSAHLNVTDHIGANRTFYIVDADKLVSSDETFIQV